MDPVKAAAEPLSGHFKHIRGWRRVATMNALLTKALKRVAALPDQAQEAIASLIIEEIEAESAWDKSFADSQDKLGEIVRRARAEVAEEGDLPYDPSDRPAE